MASKYKYKQYEASPINKLPRTSKDRILKRIKKKNISKDAITYILESQLERQNFVQNTALEQGSVQEEFCDKWTSFSPNNSEDDNDTDNEEPTVALTIREKVILMSAFVMKHGLTKQATDDFCVLLRLLCPDDMNLPTSHYALMNEINISPNGFRANFYCSTCKIVLEDEQSHKCSKCLREYTLKSLKSSDSYFFTFDVRSVLENVLESPDVSGNLFQKLTTRNEQTERDLFLKDISDGQLYKNMKLTGMEFSCSVNTDGISPFHSSNCSVWPILMSINEVDYGIRRQNTFLVALWFGKDKPCFNMFLKPIVEMCNKLSNQPIEWYHDGVKISSRCYFPLFIADSVARCSVQGTVQFNGKYGCPWCLNKGIMHKIDENRRKWIYKFGDFVNRTQEQYLTDLSTLSEKLTSSDFKKDNYHGIKSASQLLLLEKFDIVNGFTYDVMHSSYLGVVKMLTSYWFDTSNHESLFYIGRKLKEVDIRIIKCRVPYDYDRTIRSVTQRKFWKASEWRTWLFVASTVLKNILPEVYRLHLLKLSNCLMLLSDEKINQEDLKFCEENLISFVKQAEDLYGAGACTFNLHILLHATKCVKNWGPLWAYSAFQFENFNGVINTLFNGSQKVLTQIKSRILKLIAIQRSGRLEFKNEVAQEFFKSMMHSRRFSKQFKRVSKNVTFLGPFQKYAFSIADQRSLREIGVSACTGSSFRRCIINGKVYCREDQITEKRDNSVIATMDNKIWRIQKLLFVNANGGVGLALAQRIHGQPSVVNSYLTTVTHIDDAWSFIHITSISRQKFITVNSDVGRLKYLIRIPNIVELE